MLKSNVLQVILTFLFETNISAHQQLSDNERRKKLRDLISNMPSTPVASHLMKWDAFDFAG